MPAVLAQACSRLRRGVTLRLLSSAHLYRVSVTSLLRNLIRSDAVAFWLGCEKLTRNALTSTFGVKSKRIPLNFSPENVSGASVF